MKLVIRIARRRDGTHTAWCPALPGCVVQARTREQAQQRAREAARGYLASLNVALPPSFDAVVRDAMRPAC